MIGGSGRLVVNPPANQTHPCFGIGHSLKGLRIECNDCIEALRHTIAQRANGWKIQAYDKPQLSLRARRAK